MSIGATRVLAKPKDDPPQQHRLRCEGPDLSLSQELHRGAREGQGSVSNNAVRDPKTRGAAKMRVLIVEDDASIGELCRLVLEDEGYACRLAGSVVSAREAIADRGI